MKDRRKTRRTAAMVPWPSAISFSCPSSSLSVFSVSLWQKFASHPGEEVGVDAALAQGGGKFGAAMDGVDALRAALVDVAEQVVEARVIGEGQDAAHVPVDVVRAGMERP